MAKYPLPCTSAEILKCLKFPPLNLVLWACIDNFAHAHEFITIVTEDVVHGVHKVVIQSSFGVIRQHKVS